MISRVASVGLYELSKNWEWITNLSPSNLAVFCWEKKGRKRLDENGS